MASHSLYVPTCLALRYGFLERHSLFFLDFGVLNGGFRCWSSVTSSWKIARANEGESIGIFEQMNNLLTTIHSSAVAIALFRVGIHMAFDLEPHCRPKRVQCRVYTASGVCM